MDRLENGISSPHPLKYIFNSSSLLIAILVLYVDLIGKMELEGSWISIKSDKGLLVLLLSILFSKYFVESYIIQKNKLTIRFISLFLLGFVISIIGISIKEESIRSLFFSNPDEIDFYNKINILSNLVKASILWVGLFLLKTSFVLPTLRKVTIEKTWIFVSFGIFFCYQSIQPYFHRIRNPLFLIFSVILYLLLFHDQQFSKKAKHFIKKLLAPIPAYLFWILISLFTFFLFFKPGDFDSLIFTDDFGNFFYTLHQDIDGLKNGSLLYWDDNFCGGYPSNLNMRTIVFCYLPFILLKQTIGFHLFLLLNYSLLPFLMSKLIMTLFKKRESAYIAIYAGTFLNISFYNNIFLWGMLPSVCSINLVLMSMIFFVKWLENGNIHAFFFIITSSALIFTHLGHFVHSLIFIALLITYYRFIKMRDIKWGKIFFLYLFIFVIAFPYIMPFLKFNDYYRYDYMYESEYGSHTNKSISTEMLEFLKALLLPFLCWDERIYFGLFGLLIPIVIYLCLKEKKSFILPVLFFALFPLLLLVSFSPKFGLLFERFYYFAPTILSLVLASIIYYGYMNNKMEYIFLSVLLLFFSFAQPILKADTRPIKHIKNLDMEFPGLIETIKNLDDGLLLLENQANFNPLENPASEYEKYPGKHVHLEAYVQLLTGKKFFAQLGYDPHPYHSFRDTYIVDGSYQGKTLDKIPLMQMEDLFKKWGVKDIFVWSNTSKKYFSSYPETFKKIGVHGIFTHFEYTEAETSLARIKRGAVSLRSTPYSKIISVHSVEKVMNS
ncbi:hypothetical protein KKB18_05990 [bacterium]|nr:hypothetical protein [bacterium]